MEEEQAFERQDIIEDNRELFVSADHLGQVLGPSSGSSSQLIRLHQGQLFFSILHLNEFLALFTTERLEIMEIQDDEAGHGSLALRLVDSRGEEVPTVAALRENEWALQSNASSEDEQQPGEDDPGPLSFEEEYAAVRHDTPIDSGDPAGQLFERREGDKAFDAQHCNNEDIDESGEESSLFASSHVFPPSSRPLTPREELPGDEQEADSTQVFLTLRSRNHETAVSRKLRDMKLMDMQTLDRLLQNRSPLALSPLSKTRDEYVHLCTLENGTVFAFQMFRDLHAHSDKLKRANLNDPALLSRPLTGYQRNELSIVLQDIQQTDCARNCWSSAAHLIPLARRDEYCGVIPQSLDMIKRKLFYEHTTMADFKNEVESLVKNVKRFHGSKHEVTAAAERIGTEIFAHMEGAAAVGICDTKESLFQGVVREVSLSEEALLAFDKQSPLDQHGPRFVLPLGRLEEIQSPVELPAAADESIILMDIANPRKALWLYANGPESSHLVMLTDDIAHWKPSSGPGRNDGGLMKRDQVHMRRAELAAEYPDSRIDLPPGAMLFKRAARTQLVKAIQEGWGWETHHPQSLMMTTPKKRPRTMNAGSVAMRKSRRVHVLGEDEDEETIPATEHRKSKKTLTPTGPRHRAKPPGTV